MALILSPPPNDIDVQGMSWKQWFFKIRTQLMQALDLTNVSGILSPEHGGTGIGLIPNPNELLVGNALGTYDLKTLVAGSNITITNNTSTITIDSSGGGTSANGFGTVSVSGQGDVVADIPADTLTLIAGTNVTLTTNPGTDSITINASTSGGSGTTFYNVLPSNITIPGDTSYVLVGDLNLNGFNLTVNGNLGFI